MPIPGNENEHICQTDLPERNSSLFRYMEPISHYSLRATGENDTNIEVEDGCCSLDWCKDQPAMNVVQFVIAFFIVAAGHPFRVSLSQSLFIKVLGPIPQVSYHVITKSTSQQYYILELTFRLDYHSFVFLITGNLARNTSSSRKYCKMCSTSFNHMAIY